MSTRRPWSSGRNGERGFSLIEVVIAIGVLAGVLLSICSMFILGGRQLKGGKTMTEATALAHDIMETFDKLSFASMYTTFGTAAGHPAADRRTACTGPGSRNGRASVDSA